MRAVVVAIVVAGCGRLAFDPLGGGVPQGDARVDDSNTAANCTTERFDTEPGILTTWNDTVGFSANVANGVLAIQLQPNTNGYAGGFRQYFDLTNASVTVEVTQIPNGLNAESYLVIGSGSGNLYTLNYSENVTGFSRRFNGTTDFVNTAPFDPTNDRWWRLQHRASDASIEYLTSSDGVGWQLRETVSATIPVTAALMEIASGTYAGGNALPGTPSFDNFTYCLQ